MGIEILRDTLPVNRFDPLQNAVRLFREEYVHMSALRQIRTTIIILAAISIFNTPNLALEFHRTKGGAKTDHDTPRKRQQLGIPAMLAVFSQRCAQWKRER